MKIKQKFSTLLLAVFTLLFCLFFSSCSENGLVGTYKLYQIIENGQTYELGDEWDEEILTEDFYTLELYEDESFLMTSNGDGSFFVQGTWKQSENTLVLTPAPQYGNPMRFTYNESQKTLTVIGDDFGAVLKKQ